MYCDDRGVSKSLPINRRAGELCAESGSTIEVRGDAFFARSIDDNLDVFARQDFTLQDLTPDSEWIKRAKAVIAGAGAFCIFCRHACLCCKFLRIMW